MGDGTTEGREDRLVDAFVALADTLVTGYDVVDFLDNLLGVARTLLPVDAGGVLLHHDGRLQILASSSEDTQTLELFELQNDEGPCMDVYRTGEVLVISRLDQYHERWPKFVPRALDLGFRAAYAVPLRLRDDRIGALNLFARSVATFTARDIKAICGLADVTAIGILQERAISDRDLVVGQLQRALDSRVVIEQAKGRVAEHLGIGMNDAFAALRDHARSTGARLHQIASDVVAGRLDIDTLV